MKSCWETHKGKRFFFAHYDRQPVEEFRAEVVAVEEEIFKQPKGSVLLLMDTTGILITPEVLNLSKNTAMRAQPYLRKSAILGMTGARKSILDIVARFAGAKIMAFDTVEQAKDWLVAP
jgi:Holliday junction resolvasome RuvABC endonuclease subunit